MAGRSIQILSSNCNASLNTNIIGPTIDSIRITVKKSDADYCSLNLFSFITFTLRKGGCIIYPKEPLVSNSTGIGPMGITKVFATKTGLRTFTDTIACINSQYFSTYANNICLKGGRADFSGLDSNFSYRVLQGSGEVSVTNFGNPDITNTITNRWDTVSPNTLHIYEITYGSNGCFETFKDTIKVFFKSVVPNTVGLMTDANLTYCKNASAYPLASIKIPLMITGVMQPSWKLLNVLTGPAGFAASILNPSAIDSSLIFGANIIPGYYVINSIIIDTVSGCNVSAGVTSFILEKRAVLPVLRDSSVCLFNNNFFRMKYPSGTLSTTQYQFAVINGPPTHNFSQNIFIDSDSTIFFSINSTTSPPGIYTIKVFPIAGNENCNDGRSDTFQIEIKSGGRISNAGTDQRLLCNVTSTNLAGSLPSSSGGRAGFWKFLPAISTNNGNPILISDSANRNTTVSGFTNFSTYYFSWNVTDGNTGNYCTLLPDTVLIIFSGAAPSSLQKAQNDYFGLLNSVGTYTLTSNAQTPTFNVQWNKISGIGGNIISPNSQHTLLTGLTAGTYKYELVVSNTCGVFKDTVNLFFDISGLPVKLLSFSGTKKIANEDYLTWHVADELDMKNYEVELSETGNDFKTIGTVPISASAGYDKVYSFVNASMFYTNNFYRLKMVNIDGSFAYSNIIKLANRSKIINELKLYPSPATEFVTINIDSKIAQNTTIEVVNAIGQSFFKKKMKLVKGVNSIMIDISIMPKGILFFKVNDMIEKLIVE